MPHTYIRAHTHTRWPHERFKTSEVSFADWNYSYEIWLKKSFARDIPPFYNAPEAVFVKYTTDFAVSMRQDMLSVLKNHLQSLNVLTSFEMQGAVFELWRAMPYSKREALILRIWETQVRRREKQKYPFRRDEAPECILKNVAGNVEFMEDLFHAQVPVAADSDYRIVRNEAWERLNDPTKSGSRLTLSRGLRGFVEEGYLARHLYLAQFTVYWVQAILGQPLPDETAPTFASSYQPTTADVEALADSQLPSYPVVAPSMLKKNTSAAVHCRQCGISSLEKRLTCCSRCKEKASQLVHYCSAECQRRAWPTHKAVCGKKPSEIDPVPSSFASSSSGPPPNRYQLDHLTWLAQVSPRAVWGMAGESEDHLGRKKDETILFELPVWVCPFKPALDAVITLRDAAVKRRDGFSVGGTALLTVELARLGGARFMEEHVLEMLSPLVDMKDHEIKTAMEQAKAELATDEQHALLFSSSHGINPADPYGRDYLDSLQRHPQSFFVSYHQQYEGPLQTMPLPPTVPDHAATLAAARAISFRAIGEQDKDALGALQLLVRGCTWYDPTSSGSYMIDLKLWARLGALLGLSEEEMRSLREKAQAELPKRKDEEGRLVWAAVLHLRERTKRERASRFPANTWTPPNGWPRTAAEVFGSVVYGPFARKSFPSRATSAATANGSTKKKKKKAKKQQKSTAKAEPAEHEPNEGE
ncbi:hypothetical protein JCM10213_009000 [Rhodosporidiobolus nylandii]